MGAGSIGSSTCACTEGGASFSDGEAISEFMRVFRSLLASGLDPAAAEAAAMAAASSVETRKDGKKREEEYLQIS